METLSDTIAVVFFCVFGLTVLMILAWKQNRLRKHLYRDLPPVEYTPPMPKVKPPKKEKTTLWTFFYQDRDEKKANFPISVGIKPGRKITIEIESYSDDISYFYGFNIKWSGMCRITTYRDDEVIFGSDERINND
jgi:hypothetical protein